MVIKEEGQRITYSMLEALPEKIEIIDGKLEGADEFLLLSLYGIGIREFLRILPRETEKMLIDLIKADSEDNKMDVKK
ncbi:hypothetical protein [Bacillus andreraoultii]|uniref:hypothetical protein n=1 Tax=Bacillus andreraoultii TaxID=1499685 RepID=UPI000539A7C2|nr:hypothetical protein [Bacillus andreraoultii]